MKPLAFATAANPPSADGNGRDYQRDRDSDCCTDDSALHETILLLPNRNPAGESNSENVNGVARRIVQRVDRKVRRSNSR
jgi:hypothetical protein